MRIIIESHIPHIRGLAEAAGHSVSYLPPEEFTPATVAQADALIVRTRTHCNAALLHGSSVKAIATATIGMDHIDLPYCASQGIAVHNAPGCNAPAVAQYVLATIAHVQPAIKRLGIVGVGHVGSLVDRWARANGIPTLLCDPPRAAREGSADFVTLEEIAAHCDVITFHTPLDASTHHLINHEFLSRCQPGALIINAARGAVADTQALLLNPQLRYAIDCWEGEPHISLPLLEAAIVATPHIAGYSLQGKQRASAMALQAIDPQIALPMPPVAQAPTLAQIAASYNPLTDTAALRAAPHAFELLRNHYPLRPEP